MFHIAIVDDNTICLDLMETMVKRYIYDAVGIAYTCFRTPFDLMDAVEAGADFDAFLLDIFMPGMTGIEVARDLRQMGICAPVVFITSEGQHALEAFGVGAMQYLIKGFGYCELKSAMDQVLRAVCGQRRRRIVLNVRGDTVTFSSAILFTPLLIRTIKTST